MLPLLKQHAWWLAILSAAIALLAALAGILILIKLPQDYFLPTPPPRRPPHFALTLLKNLLGLIIIILGAIMSLPLVPGPGLMMIIIGLSIMNFPGKRKLELQILRTPLALAAINWLRAKTNRPPFRLPRSK